jgi:hypothetical protein
MTRRELILSTAAAATAMAVPTTGCGDGAPSLRPEPEPVAGLDARLTRILALAALAPSSHNVQPWAVRLDTPGRLFVRIDPSRGLPEVDPDGREMALSVGCFLENLAQAAAAEGLYAEVSVSGTDVSDPRLARVRLVPGPVEPAGPERIRRRRTLRSAYRPSPLAEGDLRTLLALAGPEARFFPGGSRECRRIAEATVEAMRKQTWRDAAQQELAGWIRLRKEDVRRHLDGLTVASMEATGVTGFVMRTFFDAGSLMGKRFRDTGIDICARQASEGAGFLVLSAPDRGVAALIEAGRRFERAALSLRERSIAGQPMSQALEEAPWRDAIGAELGLDGTVHLVVRLGYVDRYPEPVSPRRPPAAFVAA